MTIDFGSGALGANYAAGATGAQTYTSSLEWNIDPVVAGLPEIWHIALGLVDAFSVGAVFTSLAFTVTVNGSSVLFKDFVDRATANTWFTDRLLDLGAWSPYAPFDTDLYIKVSYALTISKAGGYGVNFVLGDPPPAADAPEPGTLVLLCLGAWVSPTGIDGLTRRLDLHPGLHMGGQGAVHGDGVQGEPVRELLQDKGSGERDTPAGAQSRPQGVQLTQDPGVFGSVFRAGRERALAHQRILVGEVGARVADQVLIEVDEGGIARLRHAVEKFDEFPVRAVHGRHAEQETGLEIVDQGHGSALSGRPRDGRGAMALPDLPLPHPRCLRR